MKSKTAIQDSDGRMQVSEDAGEQGRLQQLSKLGTKDPPWIYSLDTRHLKSKRKRTRNVTVLVDPELQSGGGGRA